MFKLLVLIVFLWLFTGVIRLALRVTWGLAKIVAVILFLSALPALIGCLLLASGVVLLLPLVPVAIAWVILNSCT